MDTGTTFPKRMKEIQDEVIALGNAVGKAISRSVESLKERDSAAARQVVAGDRLINEKRIDIEEKCLRLLEASPPEAVDRRCIAAMLNIISELERIGDHAEGIARVTVLLGDESPLKPLIDIPRMADKTVGMLRRSLDALANRDADTARQIIAEDDAVDSLYDQVFRDLLIFMSEDPRTVPRATRLLWAAQHLERSADRVTCICERVVFGVTGKMEELGASKY